MKITYNAKCAGIHWLLWGCTFVTWVHIINAASKPVCFVLKFVCAVIPDVWSVRVDCKSACFGCPPNMLGTCWISYFKIALFCATVALRLWVGWWWGREARLTEWWPDDSCRRLRCVDVVPPRPRKSEPLNPPFTQRYYLSSTLSYRERDVRARANASERLPLCVTSARELPNNIRPSAQHTTHTHTRTRAQMRIFQ